MGRKSKKASKIRQKSEFDGARLAAQIQPPQTTEQVEWDLPEIRDARDQQMRGQFYQPVKMAEAMRTDDALFPAYQNRLAPQRAIGVELVPPNKSTDASRLAREAEALYGVDGIGLHPDTLSDINGSLANHGIAIGINEHHVRDDGSRVDLIMRSWPLEFVRWDSHRRQLLTQVDHLTDIDSRKLASDDQYSRYEVPIVHGDGRWVVFKTHEYTPWKQEACILAAGLVFARHAATITAWVNGSTAHGNAKVVGTMPEGLEITNEDGTTLTTEAAGFMAMMEKIANQQAPYGLVPFGSEVDYIANASAAWQVWEKLGLNCEKAGARIYLGTDGMLGSVGGAPGIDIQALFGVATTIVQGDLGALERGVLTGVIEPWAAINSGDSSMAPKRKYLIPDADADAVRESYAKRSAAFYTDIATARESGFVVDQKYVNALADRYGIDAPKLSDVAPAKKVFKYHLDYGVLSKNELRADLGYDPVDGGEVPPLPVSADAGGDEAVLPGDVGGAGLAVVK